MRVKFTTMLDEETKTKLALVAIENGLNHKNQAIELLLREYEERHGKYELGNNRRK